ncbi:MAG: hypothetical protein ACRBN8_08365 [Nannocystales bacterium]
MPSVEPAEPSGLKLRWVLGGIAILVVAMGIAGYMQLVRSRDHFAATTEKMDALGKTVDTEGCITAVLDWHANCEANKPLCDNGVPMVMTHCLLGRDRTSTCETVDLSSAKAKWVFDTCQERGTPCSNRKTCACASAYRAIDSFCRHGQEGVAL